MVAAKAVLLELEQEKAAEQHECDLMGSEGALLGVRRGQQSLRQVPLEFRMVVTTPHYLPCSPHFHILQGKC